MGKHIICSGCSFTRQEKRIGLDGDSTNFYMDEPNMWRWPHWIQKLYPKKMVYNIGNPTNGNNLIAVSTIHKVTELLNVEDVIERLRSEIKKEKVLYNE